MRRGRGPVLLLLAALVAVGVWAWRSRETSVSPGEEQDASPEPARAPAPAEAEDAGPGAPPTLAGAPGARRTPTAGEAATADASEAAEEEGAWIRGRVSVAGVEGPLPEGARLDVRADDGDRFRLVARLGLAGSGRYEVRIDAVTFDADRRCWLTARVPGRAYEHVRVEARWGREVVQDVIVGKAGDAGELGVLSGLVIDATDRPVADLRLLLTRDSLVMFGGRPAPDPESGDEVEFGDRPEASVALVTTDAAGRFRVDGVRPTAHWIVSLDAAWYVEKDGQPNTFILPGDVTLRARSGFVLEGAVTDAATGTILPTITRAAEVRVGSQSRGTWTVSGPGGRFRWAQPIPPGGEEGFDVVLTVVADGFRRTERTVRFEPAPWTRRVEVALEALRPEEVGSVRFLHALADVEGRRLGLEVVRYEAFGTGRTGHALRPERDPEGATVVSAPRGKATFQVRPPREGAAAFLKDWQGEVEVLGGRTIDVVVPFPATGAVRLTTTRGTQPATVHAQPAVGMAQEVATLPPDGDVAVIGPLPVGRWRLWSVERGPESAVTVDVVDGTVVPAVLAR